MLILLHTSKTMHQLSADYRPTSQPALLPQASELAGYMQSLSVGQLQTTMDISEKLAKDTMAILGHWSTNANQQRPAVHSFAGDIYSGLQVDSWSKADLDYAQQSLRILSGLYGVLRPLDGIMPYRLELGYKLPATPYQNLYKFWSSTVASALPKDDTIINLAAKEYSRLVLPFITSEVLTPRFLTVSPKTGAPTFVTVHAKIARGAYAAWLIKNRIGRDAVSNFNELGYRYQPSLSSASEPVFVCQNFAGLGLSVRLQHR